MGVDLTKSLFEATLNTKFLLHSADGEPAALDLVELNNGYSNSLYESFSLLFRGDNRQVHPQRTYLVEHEALGSFDLFLTPVARNSQGTLYEAVFNRLVNQS
jgi:hypothetical protein